MAQLFGVWTPHFFPIVVLALLAASSATWPRHWILSGTPILTYLWLIRSSRGYRVFPFTSLWIIVATLNLLYAVAATSWLLYWVFFAACYPAIFACCLFQFDAVSSTVRTALRSLLKPIHFVDDKIASFGFPALEIDTDIYGLMVIRGITITLGTFTIAAHGVEVGLTLPGDVELSIRTEHVTVSFLRKINIGNVYCNFKSANHKLNLSRMASLTEATDSSKDDKLISRDTPILQAAMEADRRCSNHSNTIMKDYSTNNTVFESSSSRRMVNSAKLQPLSNQEANDGYRQSLKSIKESNAIHRCRTAISNSHESTGRLRDESSTKKDENDAVSATCYQLHELPSISRPPRESVKVTTLQRLVPQYLREVLHRLPMFYRLVLSPTSYFHPIVIDSITATASGTWAQEYLSQSAFQSEEKVSAETKYFQDRVSSWLNDARFALCLSGVSAEAYVPFLRGPDIRNRVIFDDVIVYRQLDQEVGVDQVIQLSGADASIDLPWFLLPHHEHLLPAPPTDQSQQNDNQAKTDNKDSSKSSRERENDDGAEKDVADLKLSVHGCLPLVIDQQLLDLAKGLVKASEIFQVEKGPSPLETDPHNLKEFSKAVGSSLKGSMGRTAVNAVADDKFIARTTGKVVKLFESALGEVGYSCSIPISLTPYRNQASERPKLLA